MVSRTGQLDTINTPTADMVDKSVPPQFTVEKLLQQVRDSFGLSEAAADDVPLAALGLDSLAVLEGLVALEDGGFQLESTPILAPKVTVRELTSELTRQLREKTQ